MARESRRKRDERRFGRPERLADKVLSLKWHPPFHASREEWEDNPVIDQWKTLARWAAAGINRYAVPIDATAVAEYVLTDPKQVLAWRELPPLAIPFRCFFIEMTSPDRNSVASKFRPDDGDLPQSWGILFNVMEPGELTGGTEGLFDLVGDISLARWGILAHLITERDGGIVGPIEADYIFLDETGKIVGEQAGNLLFASEYKDGTPGRIAGLKTYLHILRFPALMTLAFLNCKNVSLNEVAPDRMLNRRRQQAGLKPFVRYHTINIDPIKTVLRTEGQSDTLGLKRALHIVRGHFSTYTQERPLFGKVAGTFWMPSHVRGSAKQGVVVSDYAVHAPGMVGHTVSSHSGVSGDQGEPATQPRGVGARVQDDGSGG